MTGGTVGGEETMDGTSNITATLAQAIFLSDGGTGVTDTSAASTTVA